MEELFAAVARSCRLAGAITPHCTVPATPSQFRRPASAWCAGFFGSLLYRERGYCPQYPKQLSFGSFCLGVRNGYVNVRVGEHLHFRPRCPEAPEADGAVALENREMDAAAGHHER
jgi:hypothetical protein